MIKALKMERFLDSPGGTNVITRIFIREVGVSERGYMMTEPGGGVCA